LYEAEKVCDQVAIMKKGSVVVSGSLPELRSQITPEIRVRFDFQKEPAKELLMQISALQGVLSLQNAQAQSWEIRVEAMEVVPVIVQALAKGKAEVLSVVPQQATLEEIYLKVQAKEGQVQL
jgi:ABC-2 type transport system ATP-binding protein